MAQLRQVMLDELQRRNYTPITIKQYLRILDEFAGYVALPRSEAFRIEYWALEAAKLQRMPPEAEFSRKIILVIGGGSGIGREVALLLARKGGHIVVADQNVAGAKEVASEAAALSSLENVLHTQVDLSSGTSIADAGRFTVLQFGGLDAIVNTAAIYPVAGPDGELTEAQWNKTFAINVTGNYFLMKELYWILKDQKLPGRNGADKLGNCCCTEARQ